MTKKKRVCFHYHHCVLFLFHICIIEDTEVKQIAFVGTVISESKPSFGCYC